MYPETEFFQISGYRAASNGWFKMYDDKPMMDAIMKENSKIFRPRGQDSPVELLLGILPSGASYLLMTSEQALQFTHKHRLRLPRDSWRVTDFVSLSPIYFNTLDELSAKVATYKQRPRNKNRREMETPQDNSQANRGYVKTGTTVVQYRGYFEQQRTLYRLLTRDLESGKVGLDPPSWLGCVRVVSLVFETWLVDNRRRDERVRDPKLVNVGWTDATFPSFFEPLTGSSTIHLGLASVGLINPGSRDPCFSQVVKDNKAGFELRLRELLSYDEKKGGIPLIVLVHDEEMARSIVASVGIDTDLWSSGLENLLPLPLVKRRYKTEEGCTPTIAPVPKPCLVDMKKLVKGLMETHPGDTVPQSAKVLHMQSDIKVCAGDDSLLQLRMWTSMAQGSAIDEQRKERESHVPTCAQVLAPLVPATTANGEVDPNDYDPNDSPPECRPTIEDDFSDDDW